ncbi:hypothetical protein Tco_0115828 [Tanacetum coccineum]
MSMSVQKSQVHKMAKLQDGETRLCLVDDLTVLKITLSQTSQDKGTSSSLKSKITTTIHKLKIEVKNYELRTKDKAFLDIFEAKLKRIMIGESKLVINKVKFIKENREAGDKNHLKVDGLKPQNTCMLIECIDVQEDKDICLILENYSTERTKNFDVLHNVWDMQWFQGLKFWDENEDLSNAFSHRSLMEDGRSLSVHSSKEASMVMKEVDSFEDDYVSEAKEFNNSFPHVNSSG